MEWIILSLLIIAVAMVTWVKPRIQKMNKQEKRIFEDAMKKIDRNSNNPRINL